MAGQIKVMCKRSPNLNFSRLALGVMLGIVSLILAGCPRYAHINLYNNTSEILELNVSGNKYTVASGDVAGFKLTGTDWVVMSKLGSWYYQRNIPNPGDNGPYFDGVVKLQINANGSVYVLTKEQIAPVEEFSIQPEGYPLKPNT